MSEPSAHVEVRTAADRAVVSPERRDIDQAITLEGHVEKTPDIPLSAPTAGVFRLAKGLAEGRPIAQGQQLGVIWACPSNPPAPSADEPPCAQRQLAAVTSPAAGTLSVQGHGSGGAVEWPVDMGGDLATVHPSALRLALTVGDPAHLYVLRKHAVTTRGLATGGPVGFDVTLGEPEFNADAATTTVYGTTAPDVDLVPGAAVKVVVTFGVTSGATVLPRTAVQGGHGTGQVVTVDADGVLHVTSVELGDIDVEYIAVTGLPEDAKVLQFPTLRDFEPTAP